MVCGGDAIAPRRKWVQIAPPRKPVTRIAPRTAVCGMAYRIAQIRIVIPEGVAALSAKPVAAHSAFVADGENRIGGVGEQGERYKRTESTTYRCASRRTRTTKSICPSYLNSWTIAEEIARRSQCGPRRTGAEGHTGKKPPVSLLGNAV